MQINAVQSVAAGMAPSNLATMTAETAVIVTIEDTIRIAGVTIAVAIVMMVKEVIEVIDIGAGTVQSEGGNVAAAMDLMMDITPMVITLSMITEETQLMRRKAKPSCSEVCP